MQRLWAPWRSHYVKSKKNRKCIFCIRQKSKNSDKKNYVIYRGKYVFSMLNIFPYSNGHIMVAPYRHVKDIDHLKNEELIELMKLVNKSIKLLKKVLKPNAFNVGFNIGQIAGAGFADHIHVHIVPRWQGDTNFMPIIAQTKIIPQSLDELYEQIKKIKKNT